MILKDVEYEGVEFEVDEYAWKTLQNRFEEFIRYHGTLYKLFSTIVE